MLIHIGNIIWPLKIMLTNNNGRKVLVIICLQKEVVIFTGNVLKDALGQ